MLNVSKNKFFPKNFEKNSYLTKKNCLEWMNTLKMKQLSLFKGEDVSHAFTLKTSHVAEKGSTANPTKRSATAKLTEKKSKKNRLESLVKVWWAAVKYLWKNS